MCFPQFCYEFIHQAVLVPATKGGLIALTVSCNIPPDSSRVSHWHQMSDRVQHVDPRTLAEAHAFAWGLLQEIDRS